LSHGFAHGAKMMIGEWANGRVSRESVVTQGCQIDLRVFA
jgi:hypothetical protein